MEEAKHTKLPWKRLFLDRITIPSDQNGRESIAHFYSYGHDAEANADFVFNACNAHYDLVAALNALLWPNVPSVDDLAMMIVGLGGSSENVAGAMVLVERLRLAQEAARAALAKAGAK